jgi:plastocyanin
MTLSGASSANVITDANGDYTFTGLDNGSYTITPSRTGFIFSPTSSPQTVSGAYITAVNFTGTRVQPVTYSISGNVVSGNPAPFPGVIGVTMTLSGATSATTITGVSGSYAFTGLENGSYTITPTSTGLIFGPASSTQTVSGADITGANFLAFGLPAPQVITCPPSGTTNVTIQDFSFTPTNVVISANGIVKWTNNGTTHTVTSGTSTVPIGLFDTGIIGTGETACIQFPRTGIFVYSCTIHPDMIGGVVVN